MPLEILLTFNQVKLITDAVKNGDARKILTLALKESKILQVG
jgi:hypothetical protein